MAVVTVARYRVITGDNSTDASEVSARLEDAQTMIEEELDRPLELLERTETIRLYSSGYTAWRAYPRSTPITAIPVDVAYRIEDDVTLADVSPDSVSFWTWTSSVNPPPATITWTGGFTAETLPKKLEAAICDLAHTLTSGSVSSLIPAGASSVSVGDVSVSYPSTSGSGGSGLDMYVPGLWDRIRKYRHRRSLR